ncbi:MAG: SNF2-related protein, partial [Planctomycetes bacterium]|nr:SNF2-related protein [Planctomycetota bacterium]
MSKDRRRAPGASTAAERALARKNAAGWATSDEDEVLRRVLRAANEPMAVENMDTGEPCFSTFAVFSEASGVPYAVEIRSLRERKNSCTCPDYRINGLGTCKHVERVLKELRRTVRDFDERAARGSPKAEIRLQRAGEPSVRLDLPENASPRLREFAACFFDPSGALRGDPREAVPALDRALDRLPAGLRSRIRVDPEVREWAEVRGREARRRADRAAFEADLAAGRRSLDLLHHPLYDYQREGMLHLAFGERVMLVDDMGLGKTVQAVAACALLKERRGIRRVLVVSPASLKTEWEEQVRKFTDLPFELVYGPLRERAKRYAGPAFFFLANYEQVVRDVRDINEILAPDIIVLDEAQRIKNWSTKTAQAVKRLASPYAFVLTGTPLENRIDEIYSIVQFLDPHVFGPLFRFNREFYELDDRGRPCGYKNLAELRRRLKPLMLRRRKEDVEEEL